MNLRGLFWNNDKLTRSLQGAFLGFLKMRHSTFEAKSPIFRQETAPFDVKSLALLRLHSLNRRVGSAPIVIGCAQADGRRVFYDLAAPGVTAPNEQKAVEAEIVRALFEVLKEEFKASNVLLESNAGVSVPFQAIGPWETVSTFHSVQFPFVSPRGQITFEIPLFDDEYHRVKTIDVCGFAPEARILLVDDAMTTRKIARHQLAQVGYRYIEECADGLEAFRKIQTAQTRIDLVVADWHMPNLTGIDLLRKIRATPKFKDLPVLLATGERKQDEILTAIKERVSGYVVKPYHRETLYRAMKKAAPGRESGAAKTSA